MNRQTVVTTDIVAEHLGPFDEVSIIGSGAFGTTFKVVNGREVSAVKVLHEENPPEHLWDREVTILDGIEHPNLMSFRGAGSFENAQRSYAYLTSEFIPGPNASVALAENGPPELASDLDALALGLLAGTSELHDLSIFHRDIKPENIVLQKGDWGRPVLVDFGLAKSIDMSTHTAIGQVPGTVAYMAPERIRGDRARSRCDLYAVGVSIYECGTGQHPFLGSETRTPQQLHDAIERQKPADPREGSDCWSPELAEIVLELLEFEGHQRPSAENAINRIVKGER